MLVLCAATVFLSALLLFWIQPLFTKSVLPLLGGSPSVWNTALVFFQATLLLGYLYVHGTARLLGFRAQAALHMAVLASAFLMLPIGIAAGWTPPGEALLIPWVLSLFAVSLGLPFFAISATAPLVQKWLARTDHPAASDPYFLYSASNLGSLLALLGYPLILEPLLGLEAQSRAWTLGYAVLFCLIATTSVVLGRRVGRTAPTGMDRPTAAADRIAWTRRLHWMLLAFAPSSLLMGVTTHLTTDVAAVPLLWVLPLALYLLTFVIVFSRRPILSHRSMVKVEPHLVILLVLAITLGVGGSLFPLDLPIHLIAFFVLAMVCHGELARLRPPTTHLTEYYLWLALGGVLGGAFTAIVAPVVFDSVIEYPLAIVLACALRPPREEGGFEGPRFRASDLVGPAVLALVMLIPMLVGVRAKGLDNVVLTIGFLLFFMIGAVAVFAFRRRPLRFALGVAVLLLTTGSGFRSLDVLERDRSFFGAYRIMRDPTGRFHVLMHGTTVHGAERVDPAGWREPLTYFIREGPLGQVFAALRPPGDGGIGRVGIVGLGTGTIACYRHPDEEWTYYEIDPLVERLARDTRYFHFLDQCGSGMRVVLGDARLTLREAEPASFDLIVIDAFSSDAIPIHLLTREALDLYMRLLAPDGVLAWNISNRNVDLRPVLGNLVAHLGYVGRTQRFFPPQVSDYRGASEWVVVTRTPERMAEVATDPRWKPLPERPEIGLWTDDFSNIVRVLKWTGR